MTDQDIDLALSRMAGEIVEAHEDLARVALIGIRRRGVPLAERLRQKIEEQTGIVVDLGILDINFYRDDLSLVGPHPKVGQSELDFDVRDRELLLVDDVLFTGRTTRAALESLLDYGRAARVELVALIDRGNRELPIQADYVGQHVDTAREEVIDVRLPPIDEDEAVYLTNRELLFGEGSGDN